jgi:two-component system NtrC family sensor kinase
VKGPTASGVKEAIRVVIIDDDEDDFLLIRDLLTSIRDETFKVDWISNYADGMAALHTGSYDVCLLDYRLGEKNGIDFLKELSDSGLKTPVIVLTGCGEHDVDLEAMRHGAADYLVKSEVAVPLIERSIRYALHRSRTQEALQEREAQILMQERLASVGMLASSLAHEIGTPLGVIRGRAEYLSMQLKAEPLVQKNADIIISQIDRVSKLIRSLLNLARGERAVHSDQVPFAEVAAEVLELMGHEFRKHGIEIRNELPVDIRILVSGKSEPLHQVLLNLLINSVHAIESAKRQGRLTGHFIRIGARLQGDIWEISVFDSGCGISMENLKKLFRPFFTTKDIGVGTGLGLATSFRILESWGGSIRAESVAHEGATFTILLPASKSEKK